MFFGRESSLRLEPMAEVRYPARNGPFLDDLSDGRRNLDVKFFSEADGRDEFDINVLRQLVAHLPRAKGVDSEVFRCRNRIVTGDRNVRRGDRTRADGADSGSAGRQ